jgi:FecR protein
MKTSIFGALGFAALGLTPVAWAEPAATLLFTQAGVQIVDPQGISRAAKQGDVLATGERLLTPPGAITQIRLPDGSLVGMRPGSELKIDLPPKAAPDAGNIVSLQQGALRLIGAELMDAKKRSSVTLQSGNATMTLVGADLQSALVRPGDNNPQGSGEAGAYNRLLTGSGSIGSGSGSEQLAVRQTSFVGASGVAPVTLALAPSSVFVGAPAVALVSPAGALNLPLTPLALTKILPAPTLPLPQLPTVLGGGGPNFPKLLPIPPMIPLTKQPTLLTGQATVNVSTATANLINSLPSAGLFVPSGFTSPAVVPPSVALVSPTTTLIAPTTTLVSPTTTLVSPTTAIPPLTTTLLVAPKVSCVIKILAGIRICI